MALVFSGKGGRRIADQPGFAMLAEVRAYWEGLRHGSALPRRDDIDPRGIAGALENTFLLERVAPGIARFRLAGMQLHDLMGMDVRGMAVSALIEPQGRNRMAEGLEAVFAWPGLMDLRLEGERGVGKPSLAARMLLLPLTGVRGDVDLALGCLAFEGAMGRAPRRFAIAGMSSEQLPHSLLARICDPDAARAVARDLATGLAEAAAEFTARPRPPRAKPHLRLVSSRD